MADSFADVLKELFPPISEKTKEGIKKVLLQHKNNPNLIFATSLTSHPSQGEILTNIQFLMVQDDGEYLGKKMHGMLISHTCDFDQNDTVLFAPAYSIDFFVKCFNDNEGKLSSLKKNLIYDKFFVPSYNGCPELVVDFNGINSFSTEFIRNNLKEKKSERKSSLSQEGYYYLLSKLTVHFMRPEVSKFFREETF